MPHRKNISLDDDAQECLERHSQDNHSEIIRELIKAYYQPGCFDEQGAAIEVRKKQLERQREQIQTELESVNEELESLESYEVDTEVSDIETIASEITIVDPEKATANNPAIRKRATEHGLDPAVVADAVREQALAEQRGSFQVAADDD